MARYAFLTVWLLESPAEPVWDAIGDAARWPQWWPGVTRTRETAPGHDGDVGKRFTIAWRSVLPYELEFEMTVVTLDRPHTLEGRATGDLDGIGRWRLYERAGVTAVLYEWNVETTKRWMNAVAPLGAPIFKLNHDYVMRRGAEGIARYLGVALLGRS